MGQIGHPETSVRNFHFTLRNIPEERRSQIFPLLRNNQPVCEAHWDSYSVDTVGPSLRVQWPGRKVDHLRPIRVYVNVCSYISATPTRLRGGNKDDSASTPL